MRPEGKGHGEGSVEKRRTWMKRRTERQRSTGLREVNGSVNDGR